MARNTGALLPLTLVIVAGIGYTIARREHGHPARAAAGPTTAADTMNLTPYGRPGGHETAGRLLRKSRYECLNDPHLKISRWVAYMAAGEAGAAMARYSGSFYADPGLPPGRRSEPADYNGIWKSDKSGYDRGHQAPDATLKRFGPEAQRETYSLANITPQHSQINQGIWSDLEAAIRSWSSTQSPVWVVTGPIFYARKETTWVGPNRVAVPHAYYTIVARNRHSPPFASHPEVLTFLVANNPEAPWYSSLARFLVSVDSVERLSGLDFLPALPDSVESQIEAATARAVWP